MNFGHIYIGDSSLGSVCAAVMRLLYISRARAQVCTSLNFLICSQWVLCGRERQRELEERLCVLLGELDWKLKTYTNVSQRYTDDVSNSRLQWILTLTEDLIKFSKCLLQIVLSFFSLLLLEYILKTQDWVKEAIASEQNKCLFKACSRKELKATLSAFLMETWLSYSVLLKYDKEPRSSCIWSQAQVLTREARVIFHNPQHAIGRCINMVMK